MAGIGFVLRTLYRQDNLSGLLRVCLYSVTASTGPWLFTVLALGAIGLMGKTLVSLPVLFDFRVILIYNFSFSLVISGPVFMIATRYLADCIHARDVHTVPGMLVGTLCLLWGVEIVLAMLFYFGYADLSMSMAVSALLNFLLVSALWLMSIFISALKNYRLITWAFLIGMAVAVLAALGLARAFGAAGILNGFSIGVSVIIAILLANVLAAYPYSIIRPFAFLSYFRKYWEIAASGVIYSMAIWVDKWVMWFAPEGVHLPSGLIVYPHYDSAMFIAYLTTIPAMAMFLFSTETHFFERYVGFYRDIVGKASYAKIEQSHQAVMRSIVGSSGFFFLLQGSIALIGVFLAPEIIARLDGHFMQIGMLRYGILGACFQVLTLFLLILLSYFDNRRASLAIQSLFLVLNAALTWASLHAGFEYYGYGYFLSSFITFLVASLVVARHALALPYHAFISTNTSIR